MVGHRFVEALRSRDADGMWRVTVLAEEADAAYDRVGLTGYTEHWDRGLLALPGNDYSGDDRVELRLGSRVTEIDRTAKSVLTADGQCIDYDALVLATGSYAFVPPVPGHDLPACHVYRTLDDLDAIRADAAGIGGQSCSNWRRHRRWPPRTGGRERAAPVRAADPRRRDGAPADGPAAGRGGWSARGTDDRRPRDRGTRRRRHRLDHAGATQSARPAVRRGRRDVGDAERRDDHRRRSGCFRGGRAPP